MKWQQKLASIQKARREHIGEPCQGCGKKDIAEKKEAKIRTNKNSTSRIFYSYPPPHFISAFPHSVVNKTNLQGIFSARFVTSLLKFVYTPPLNKNLYA
jgi:hypothetical protein